MEKMRNDYYIFMIILISALSLGVFSLVLTFINDRKKMKYLKRTKRLEQSLQQYLVDESEIDNSHLAALEFIHRQKEKFKSLLKEN